MAFDFLKSKVFIVAGAAVLASTVYFLGKELNKKYQIRKEIQGLEAQISYYQSKNEEALKLINYFQTSEYQERQARSLLNLQKPGEFAVALPPAAADATGTAGTLLAPQKPSNLKLWWNYFFGRK